MNKHTLNVLAALLEEQYARRRLLLQKRKLILSTLFDHYILKIRSTFRHAKNTK